MKRILTILMVLTALISCNKNEIKNFDPQVKIIPFQGRDITPVINNIGAKITKTCVQSGHPDYTNVWMDVYNLKLTDHLVASYSIGLHTTYAFDLPIIYEGNVGYSFVLPNSLRCQGIVKVNGVVNGKLVSTIVRANCAICQ